MLSADHLAEIERNLSDSRVVNIDIRKSKGKKKYFTCICVYFKILKF